MDWLATIRSNRDRLLAMLPRSGSDGVYLTECYQAAISCPAVHVESLVFDGHRIRSDQGQEPGTLRYWRKWTLERDAAADEFDARRLIEGAFG